MFYYSHVDELATITTNKTAVALPDIPANNIDCCASYGLSSIYNGTKFQVNQETGRMESDLSRISTAYHLSIQLLFNQEVVGNYTSSVDAHSMCHTNWLYRLGQEPEEYLFSTSNYPLWGHTMFTKISSISKIKHRLPWRTSLEKINSVDQIPKNPI